MDALRSENSVSPFSLPVLWKPNPRTFTAGNDLIVPSRGCSQALSPPGEPETLTQQSGLLWERRASTVTKHVHIACLELALNSSDIVPSPLMVLLLKPLSVSDCEAFTGWSCIVHLETKKYIYMQWSIPAPGELKTLLLRQ